MRRLQPVGRKKHWLPEDVSHAEAAHRHHTPGPSGVFVVGGPHLDDDEGKNSGVLQKKKETKKYI